MGFFKDKAAETVAAAEAGAKGAALADMLIYALSEGSGSIEENLKAMADAVKEAKGK